MGPAHLLANAEQRDAADTLKREYQQLLATMVQQQDLLGALAPAVLHFQKKSPPVIGMVSLRAPR